MSSGSVCRILVGGSVLGIWLAAACSGSDGTTPPTTTPQSDSQVLDDDDYTSAPILPCDPEMSPETSCMIEGEVTTSAAVSATGQTIRVAFFTPSQLSGDGRPADYTNPTSSILLSPPFDFPIPFRAVLVTGSSYTAEAWQDADGDGLQAAPDLLGYSSSFTPDAETKVSIELQSGVVSEKAGP